MDAGPKAVTVRAAGYLPLSHPVEVKPGAAAKVLEFGLSPGGTIEGIVRDDARSPLANALVFVGQPGSRFNNDSWGATARSLRDGTFQLESVEPGAHLIRAYKPGHAEDSQEIIVEGGRAPRIELTLTLLGEIAGTVWVDGMPVSVTHVCVSGQPRGSDWFRQVSAMPDGTFRVGEVPAGETLVTVRFVDDRGEYLEHPDGPRTAIVEPGLTTVVDFGR